MNSLVDTLSERFNPARSGDLDATIEIRWHAGGLSFSIQEGAFALHDTVPPPPADLVLHCRDESHAVALFSGSINPIDAFMAGEFRGSGYVVWVFQTLAAFSGNRQG